MGSEDVDKQDNCYPYCRHYSAIVKPSIPEIDRNDASDYYAKRKASCVSRTLPPGCGAFAKSFAAISRLGQTSRSTSQLSQGFLDVVQQVRYVLNTHRHPDQTGGDACLRKFLLAEKCVRHRRGMLDERLHAA